MPSHQLSAYGERAIAYSLIQRTGENKHLHLHHTIFYADFALLYAGLVKFFSLMNYISLFL